VENKIIIKNRSKGFSLVEALIGASIIVLTLTALSSAFAILAKSGRSSISSVKASYLLNEGAEAILMVAKEDWTFIEGLTVGSTYGLEWKSNTWYSTTTTSVDNIYYRQFVVSGLYRDSNSDIASSGTLDSEGRKVDVGVSWYNGSATSTKDLSFYVFKDE